MTKLTVIFPNFANAPKNCSLASTYLIQNVPPTKVRMTDQLSSLNLAVGHKDGNSEVPVGMRTGGYDV
jgi:hypothetical protein